MRRGWNTKRVERGIGSMVCRFAAGFGHPNHRTKRRLRQHGWWAFTMARLEPCGHSPDLKRGGRIRYDLSQHWQTMNTPSTANCRNRHTWLQWDMTMNWLSKVSSHCRTRRRILAKFLTEAEFLCRNLVNLFTQAGLKPKLVFTLKTVSLTRCMKLLHMRQQLHHGQRTRTSCFWFLGYGSLLGDSEHSRFDFSIRSQSICRDHFTTIGEINFGTTETIWMLIQGNFTTSLPNHQKIPKTSNHFT